MIRFTILACLFAQAPGGSDSVSQSESQRKEFQRVEALIESPSRPNSQVSYYASLEWVIDSSDQILTAKLVEKDGVRRFELEEVLKPAGKEDVNWPVGEEERLNAIAALYQSGDRLLFCLWIVEKEKSPRLYDYFPLIPIDDPRRKDADRFYENLPDDLDDTAKMYHFRRYRGAGFSWLAIDKTGKWIRSHHELLKQIKQRLADGSRVPADCDRDAVAARESVYGGWYTYEVQEPNLSAAEFPCVLVPPEPEYRQGLLRMPGGRGPSHLGMWPRIPKMANYKDDEMIAQLKDLLDDNLVLVEQWWLPNRQPAGTQNYIWGKEQPPPGDPRFSRRSMFVFRKAAYEALLQMKVEVKRPRLSPDEAADGN